MNGVTRVFVYLTIVTFLGFFLIEALLWTWPLVYEILLPQLNPELSFAPADQAQILRALFINQGAYNLLVAAAGVSGLVLISRGQVETGRSFLVYTCLFGVGAAITLLATTHAFVLGAFQLIGPVVALALMRREKQRENLPA